MLQVKTPRIRAVIRRFKGIIKNLGTERKRRFAGSVKAHVWAQTLQSLTTGLSWKKEASCQSEAATKLLDGTAMQRRK